MRRAHGEASPGDHLQTLYHYWLVGHQLEDGNAPWLDPYSFQPEADPQPNYAGWPFGFLFWPLGAVFGLVVGWNVLQIVIYALAGLFACAWLRELGLPRGAALAGGLVFAIAPYRVQQSVGHLLGPISILLPLSLFAFERARRGSVLVARAVGGGDRLDPALGTGASRARRDPVLRRVCVLPHARAEASCSPPRSVRSRPSARQACSCAQTIIKGSTQSGGRSLDEISTYSARVGDFLSRNVDHARSEQFVFLGWVTPLLALAGLVLLIRARRYALAAVLGLGALIPIVLALGTRTPIYTALWHALPPFRFPRVPERLLPIACLCIAALVAFVVARSTRLTVVALAIAVLFVDLHARVYGKSEPGDPDGARPVASGRLLELPVFDPGVHYGSVYLWYDTSAQRERPGGYSTTAPKAAKPVAEQLEPLNCGDWTGNAGAARRPARHPLDRVASRPVPAQPGRAEHGVVRVACAAGTGLDGAADGRAGLGVRAARHRPAAGAARAVTLAAGVLPGLVRRHRQRAIHERDARAVLDLRQRQGAAAVRALAAAAARDRARR